MWKSAAISKRYRFNGLPFWLLRCSQTVFRETTRTYCRILYHWQNRTTFCPIWSNWRYNRSTIKIKRSMKVTIEHSFCPYCDEVTELYFRIINTILFLAMRRNCVKAWDSWRKNSTWWIFHIRLRCTTPLGLPATSQRQNQNIRASYYDGWISMTPWTNIIDWLEWNHPFQPYFHFPFITFSFGCATPFCRNQPFAQSELETTLWKVWFFLPFFLPVPFFFDADITILQGWATYASVHSWLTHSLCSGLFSDWMVFCLLQSQFKPGMSRFGFAILHWLSDGCLAFVPTFGFALFPYHYRFTCFPFP